MIWKMNNFYICQDSFRNIFLCPFSRVKSPCRSREHKRENRQTIAEMYLKRLTTELISGFNFLSFAWVWQLHISCIKNLFFSVWVPSEMRCASSQHLSQVFSNHQPVCQTWRGEKTQRWWEWCPQKQWIENPQGNRSQEFHGLQNCLPKA